jgi:UDP-N-acetylmuramoyl-tripeptide--D-alanyl-D-alanine ligase
MSFVLSERTVREAIGLAGGSPDRHYTTVSTDTRTLSPGALFVALAGERFDGHEFLAAARDAGAVAAIVRLGCAPVEGLDLLEVPDTLRAYGLLARARRRTLQTPVIAITGTNGKTSTKEMLAAVLRTRFRTHATRANLNNLVGVPQTILEAPPDTEALVVEAGANLPGEIERYREIIEPDISIVTNAAEGHLEGFGSLDGVVEEKLSLTRGVGLALVGMRPPSLAEGARARGAIEVLTVDLEEGDVRPDRMVLGEDGRATLAIDGRTFTLPVIGRHQAGNALFAWAVARALHLDLDAAAAALSDIEIPWGRGERRDVGGLTIINDCYNANPASFRAVIDLVQQIRGRRRLAFVAGTMLELGPAADRMHREVAEALVALKPDLLAVVGAFVPAMEPWVESLGDRLLCAPDAPSLAPLLAARLRGDELVVLKASRGMALERILPAITRHAAESTEA